MYDLQNILIMIKEMGTLTKFYTNYFVYTFFYKELLFNFIISKMRTTDKLL